MQTGDQGFHRAQRNPAGLHAEPTSERGTDLRRQIIRTAAIPLLAAALLACEAAAQRIEPAPGAPSVAEIIDRAIETDCRSRQHLVETQYRFRHVNVTERLDGENRVERTDRHVYRVYPRDGEPFYELVETMGRKATKNDIVKEDKIRSRLRDEINTDPDFRDSGSRGFAFTHNLIDRYTAKLLGREQVKGRTSYVLGFRPKSGKLPVRRRIDRALNKAFGRIWVDAEDFGLSRMEFSLLEPMRVWGGLIASITRLEGRMELRRLAPGAWHPDRMRLRIDGRMLFSSLNRRMLLEWSNFERVTDEEAGL